MTQFKLVYIFQDWFTECARVISHSCGQTVEWSTPLGLPVVQPYNRRNKLTDYAKKGAGIKMGEHFISDMYEYVFYEYIQQLLLIKYF